MRQKKDKIRITHHLSRVEFPEGGQKASQYFKKLRTDFEGIYPPEYPKNPYQYEIAYYQKIFAQMIERKNEACKKARKPSRCVNAKILHGKPHTCPEEIHIQFGSKKTIMEREIAKACVLDYIEWINAWCAQHGNIIYVLLAALSKETPYQAVIRRVWQYKGENGNMEIGQTRALKQAGVPLPNDAEIESRSNNAKITFDQESREALLTICYSYGLNVTDEAKINTLPQAKALHEKAKQQADKAAISLKQMAEIETKTESIPALNDTIEQNNGMFLIPEKNYNILRIRKCLSGPYQKQVTNLNQELTLLLQKEQAMEAEIMTEEQKTRNAKKEYEILELGYMAVNGTLNEGD